MRLRPRELSPAEREAQSYAHTLQQQVQDLLFAPPTLHQRKRQTLPLSLQELAEILGATAYLVHGKHATSFRVKDFVADRVRDYKETGTRLTLPKPEAFGKLQGVVFPPGEGEINIGSGKGMEEKGRIERTRFTMELLGTENILYESYGSETTSNMMRQRGYTVFFLPTLEKTLCVNNEEGNATYLLFGTQTWQDAQDIFFHYTKDQLQEMQMLVEYIPWSSAYDQEPSLWKSRILEALHRSNPLSRPTLYPSIPSNEGKIPLVPPEPSPYPKERYTISRAIELIEEALTAWQQLPEDKRRSFGPTWLEKNGYKGLCGVILSRLGGWEAVISQCSPEVQKNFIRQERSETYTLDSAAQSINEAFTAWQQLPEDQRGSFGPKWLAKNGYSGLHEAVRDRLGGWDAVIPRCSQEVQKNFTRQEQSEKYTINSAAQSINEAFTAWQQLPEDQRGSFSPEWLRKNGYKGLYGAIINRLGGWDAVIPQCSQEVQKNFTRQEKSETYTIDSAAQFIDEALTVWQQLPQDQRGSFGPGWLAKNGYSGPHEAVRDRLGGWDAVIPKCSLEVQKNFTRQERSETYTIDSAIRSIKEAFTAWQKLPEDKRESFGPGWLVKNGYTGLYRAILKRLGGWDAVISKCSPEVREYFEYRKRNH